MDLETAVTVMITSFGNAALAGQRSPLPLDGTEEQELHFVCANGDEIHGLTAWFDYLTATGCTQLCFGRVHEERHLAEADRSKLPKYGRRFIGTTYMDGRVEIWTRELVLIPKDERYPHGHYRFVFTAIPALALPDAPTDTEQVVAKVLAAVDNAADLADSCQLLNFAACFRRARQALVDPSPPQPSRWLCPSAPEMALRLFTAADHAYVFGTIGSWNDVFIVGDLDYERVTSALSEAIGLATTHAANLQPSLS
ncbi:hypothetical protein [Floridanema evergladense]|uniref:Uncharacterized protein n=1 Tax=Floridaenema evergladense BLCC-F167 TaxID=3153639 RepID=A0ABV4WQF4_9CYAN